MKTKVLGKDTSNLKLKGIKLLEKIKRNISDIKYGTDIWNVYDFLYLNNDLPSLKVLEIKSDQKINGEISFEVLGKVSKEPKNITTKSKVGTKEPEKINSKSKENVSSSNSVKKSQKKSASTIPKQKKPVDKKALENKNEIFCFNIKL